MRITGFYAMLTTIVVLSCAAASNCEANSRFEAINDSSERIDFAIFNGGDKICLAPAKNKQLQGGESGSFGCEGNGKHRCKVSLEVRHSGGEFNDSICKDLGNSCGIKVPNGATLTVNEDLTCTLDTP